MVVAHLSVAPNIPNNWRNNFGGPEISTESFTVDDRLNNLRGTFLKTSILEIKQVPTFIAHHHRTAYLTGLPLSAEQRKPPSHRDTTWRYYRPTSDGVPSFDPPAPNWRGTNLLSCPVLRPHSTVARVCLSPWWTERGPVNEIETKEEHDCAGFHISVLSCQKNV